MDGDHGAILDNYQLTKDGTMGKTRELARFKDYLSLAIFSYHDLAFKYHKTYDEAISCQLSKN